MAGSWPATLSSKSVGLTNPQVRLGARRSSMQNNHIKRSLQAGGTVLGTCITDCFNPEIVVAIEAAGLDFFFSDSEHSRTGLDDVQGLVRVAKSAGVVPLVRVPQPEYFFLARMLDVGVLASSALGRNPSRKFASSSSL